MTAIVHRVPALSDNYIWLFEYAPGTVAVIDPAESAPVLQAAQDRGLRISHILNTHWHPDHVGGNLDIQQESGCTIIGPAGESHPIPGMNRAVQEGDQVTLGEHTADVLFVGAHTAGHIAYHFPSARALFCGDTLFAMGCGRLFEGTPADMFAAMQKLKALPADTHVYCAHEYTLSNARFAITIEPDNAALQQRFAEVQRAREANQPTVPFQLREEFATNPFLRAVDAAELGARRAAKDSFRG